MKKTGKLMRALAALLTILLMTTSGAPALAASFKAKINSASAKVYNVPSTSSKIFVQNGKGITVTVTGYANGWARVKYKGNTGYTKVKNLNLVSPPKGYTKKSTPVYRQDSTSSSRMGTLSAGTAVNVVGVSGNFYRIQNSSGTVTGYVKKGTLATKSAMMAAYKYYLALMNSSSSNGSSSSGSSSSSSSSGSSSSGTGTAGGSTGGSTSGGNTSGGNTPSGGDSTGGGSSSGDNDAPSASGALATKINSAILLAESYIGKPYAESANPPSSFNCSVLVRYCYSRVGIDMKSNAAAQCADTRYPEISLSNIERGDILCFDTNGDGTCDHTAIYLGDNKFIESSEVANAVQKNDLSSFYKSCFILARRPAIL